MAAALLHRWDMVLAVAVNKGRNKAVVDVVRGKGSELPAEDRADRTLHCYDYCNSYFHCDIRIAVVVESVVASGRTRRFPAEDSPEEATFRRNRHP